jgi:hypothetical protein
MSRARPDDRGAALVEFALILPLLMTLLLGMFTGGLAYNSKITVTGATREGSRYGATLPLSSGCGGSGTNLDQWLTCVSNAAVGAASGEMASGADNRYICVSYVNPSGGAVDDNTHATRTREVTGNAAAVYTDGSDCFTKNSLGADGLTGKRVQVVLSRTRDLELLFTKYNLTLRASSVTPYEQ